MTVANFRAMILLAFTMMAAGQAFEKNFSTPTQTTKIISQNNASLQESTSSVEAPAPVLVLLAVHWTGICEATIYVTGNQFLNYTSLPLSSSSEIKIQRILQKVCQKQTGCKNKMSWKNMSSNTDCYKVDEKGPIRTSNCLALGVKCEVVVLPDERSELQVYKVVTALLSCGLLVMLLVHFTKPTVEALQRRLSERREHRWIGPTQSHSALERLTVSNSGERTSTYNF
ncbi:uncharacterized protein LOC105354670 isoform X2 [Oryzias latipes]|uniref:uncharacterized protein LOC105354670 isoform X2 n=1 Tax=Oryzias latipes TaxID=8090 RepID=UPI0005CC4269|nr:uncharacterized protein LOC105354670 isoform X2 [Oryzias latipes]